MAAQVERVPSGGARSASIGGPLIRPRDDSTHDGQAHQRRDGDDGSATFEHQAIGLPIKDSRPDFPSFQKTQADDQTDKQTVTQTEQRGAGRKS
jgi:hypothetical protein